MRRFSALWLVAALGAGSLLAACSKPAEQPEPIRAVKVVRVQTASLQAAAEFSGEVRARTESRLGFRVGGKLLSRPAQLGQRVQAGALLAQLDAQDLQLAAEAARAQLAAAQTNRDLAQADLKRFKELREQNFISGAELERREANFKAAQAQVEQAQAQAKGQGNQSAYARLLADGAGVVTAVDAEPGQVLAAGTPVVRLALDGPRDVLINVPEDKVAAIQVGGQADVRLWGSAKSIPATVREVAASADPVTRTFAVKLALPASENLPLGATVTVLPKAFSRTESTAIKLPTSALQRQGDKVAVWVLDEASMTVQARPIQIATADGNEVVVASGLEPGMPVVVTGVHVLHNGQKVRIYQEKQSSARTNAVQSAAENVANPVPAAVASAAK